MPERPGEGIRGADNGPATNVLQTRKSQERLFQTVGVQHENRRAAIFVGEDCVDSSSHVDDLKTRERERESVDS